MLVKNPSFGKNRNIEKSNFPQKSNSCSKWNTLLLAESPEVKSKEGHARVQGRIVEHGMMDQDEVEVQVKEQMELEGNFEKI